MAEQLRVGVIADTHGNRRSFEKALAKMGEIDLLLHAGDFANDAIAMGEIYDIPVQAVAGNCDFFGAAEDIKVLDIAGHRVLLVHGHRQHVKRGLDELYELGEQNQADVCIFGHSHCSVIENIGSMLLINPGSPSQPRDGEPSCMVLMLTKEKPAKVELLVL